MTPIIRQVTPIQYVNQNKQVVSDVSDYERQTKEKQIFVNKSDARKDYFEVKEKEASKEFFNKEVS